MKIAAGAAKGLEYLHDKANPPVIYRDLKSSNILLDEGYHPKLSDFGLAKLGPVGDKTHVSTRVMGTYGYCAPEYAMTGQLTLKSDVYSFGVVFLELITGRKAIDNSRDQGEHNLVAWVNSPHLFYEDLPVDIYIAIFVFVSSFLGYGFLQFIKQLFLLFFSFLGYVFASNYKAFFFLLFVIFLFSGIRVCRHGHFSRIEGSSPKWLIHYFKVITQCGDFTKLLQLQPCVCRNKLLQGLL